MSSISNPNPNPNPNPKFSATIKGEKNRNRNRNRKNKNKGKFPKWVELPEDIWFLIFTKVRTIEIIENVQKVCMLFRKICKQPSMFRVMDMQLPCGYCFNELPYDLNAMTRFAVDRSEAGLVDIYLEFLCDDETLEYIVERSKNLKHLRLGHYVYVSDEGLIEAVQMLPMLEEVEIIICSFSEDAIEAIGLACPSLKSFTLNHVASKRFHYTGNEEALAIARSMPKLQKLQLIGNCMTNEGLKAILDGCPLLESLDLRACLHIDLSGALGKRCEKLKQFRRPCDSTADYSHQAFTDNDAAYKFVGQQESKYDSDDFDIYGFCPGYSDFAHLQNHYPESLDDFDDFPFCYDYFAGGGFLGYESSD